MTEQADIVGLLARVSSATARPGGAASQQAVQEVVRAAERLLDGCRACSITQRQGNGYVTPAASNPVAMELDRAQYSVGHGPCIAACVDGQVHEFSLADESNPFPTFARAARDHGVHASVSVPVPFLGDSTAAAVNIYAATWPPPGLGTRAEPVIAFLARCAGAALGRDPASIVDLAAAAARRELVERAVRATITAGAPDERQAFGALVRRSRDEHRSIYDVARDVIDAGPANGGGHR